MAHMEPAEVLLAFFEAINARDTDQLAGLMDDAVVGVGTAGGTISADGQLLARNRWKIPAAWRAVIERGKVKEFRVYADNKPVYDILARLGTNTQSGPPS